MGLIDTGIPNIEPRKVPVYLLIDISGSMKGERIESVKLGIQDMLNALNNDPYALETVHISIITFGRNVEQLLPLTSIDKLQVPEITTDEYGPTHMGAALEILLENVEKEVIKCTAEQKGDHRPILFILTDGQPTDKLLCNQVIPRVKSRKFNRIICCALGPTAKTEYLKLLTNEVYLIDTLDGVSLTKFISGYSGFPGEYNINLSETDLSGDAYLAPPLEGLIL